MAKASIDFLKMTETIGEEVRKIKRSDERHVRIRDNDSDRVKETIKPKVRRKRNFDTNSFRWLDQNYIRLYGLRNWTWQVIIDGIISEHLIQIERGGDDEIDAKYITLIWQMVLETAGIEDLNKVPSLTDPDHKDVKIILVIYSLESFLFKRLNQSCRDQDTSAIKTLGPFAVALTKIINHIQSKRKDSVKGEFTCYSGLALPV